MVRLNTANSLNTLIKRYRVSPIGPSSQPGYICIVRKGNLIRFGFSRRPKEKLVRSREGSETQELVWYGYTDNMLFAKQRAQAYFSKYHVAGDWLRISPGMAMTYFKRLQNKEL